MDRDTHIARPFVVEDFHYDNGVKLKIELDHLTEDSIQMNVIHSDEGEMGVSFSKEMAILLVAALETLLAEKAE